MTHSSKQSVETRPLGFSKIPREDLPLLFNRVRNDLQRWINNKDQIGKTLSKENWDEWNQFFEWDEVEEVVVPAVEEVRELKVKNLRVREEN